MNARKPMIKPAALILAGVVAGGLFSELMRAAPAFGQPDKLPPDKVLNSAEQTRAIAVGIAQINDRLARIESSLTTGIKVKVTDMPAVQLKDK